MNQGSAQGQRPVLTVKEAAEAAGTSVDTVRRRIRAKALPGAYRADDPAGTWMIPVEDLIAAGFHLHTLAGGDDHGQQGGAAHGPDSATAELRAELEAARAALVDERRRREVAEALAAERDRSLRGYEAMIRALPSAGATSTPAAPTQRRGLFRRSRGGEVGMAQAPTVEP